jgi:hypothetical protein
VYRDRVHLFGVKPRLGLCCLVERYRLDERPSASPTTDGTERMVSLGNALFQGNMTDATSTWVFDGSTWTVHRAPPCPRPL